MAIRHRALFALVLAASAGGSAARAEEAAASRELSELVVTASLRREALASAPVSVTAITPEALQQAHITRPEDLVRETPGLQYDAEEHAFSIRGVSSEAGSATTGLYVDDVPLQIRAIGFMAQSALPSLFDLDRVEVIRGPQGTLFGAGAEGGVVRFVTTKPVFGQPDLRLESEVSASDGGGGSYAAGAAGNATVLPGYAAVRLGAWYRHDGGWVDRVDTVDKHVTDADANRGDRLAIRVTGLLQPTPSLQLTPMLLVESRRQHDTDEGWEALSDPAAGVWRNANPTALADDDRFTLAALGLRQDLGGADLVGDVGVLRRRQRTAYDGSMYNLSWLQQQLDRPLLTPTGFDLPIPRYAAPAPIHNRQDDVTLELRLESHPDGLVTWTAGVFLQRSLQVNEGAIVDPQFGELNLALFGPNWEQRYNGYGLLPGDLSYWGRVSADDRQAALFGEARWSLTPHLRLITGLRIARTRLSFVNAQDGPYNAPGPSGASGAQRETPVTPKLGLSWEDDGRLLYVSAAKGYRIGGANTALPLAFCAADLQQLGLAGTPVAYRSDSTWNYEAGAKGHAFDRRLELAASVFQIDWRGIQQNVYLPGCGFQFTANAGRARSRGFDLQLRARLAPGMSVGVGAGYVDARYAETTRAGDAAGALLLAAKGDALPGAPWQVAVDWDWRFSAAGRPAFLDLGYAFASRDRLGPVQDPLAQAYDPRLPPNRSADDLHLRLGVRFDGWEAAVFGDNLTGDHAPLVRAHEDQGTDLFTITTPRPRTIGVSLTRGM